MKNVLIATDFSPHSKAAIASVLKRLRDQLEPCRVLLLHTYLVSSSTPNEKVIEENDRLRKLSLKSLAEEKDNFVKNLNNPIVSVEANLRMGTLQNVIIQLVEKEKFDFVAMGNSGGKSVREVYNLLKNRDERPFLFLADEEVTNA